ncbi:IS4 family transposase [Nostoc sp. 'Peltigera malacea cyanobiont' DB3992]|uniref:IS4 family transposase n=1 Tax=Nostoc sp. 'Peltigera malacea cyanobiont' DB3992 TaxID=1206980 RepID=UPI000C039417|nr:IS4 family transposase [Nostoc sp. 'Peltigera malacea cyanobiont' DB3992]PHM09633.1 IS4 family transposase [Nostoc sp. 'Peltigera malacea cyanobiont' DB3992]
MRQHQSINIRQISRNWAEQMGYYRFLENENVTLSELVRSLSDDCLFQVAQRQVLAISDSSEINLQSHAGRLSASGLGVVGNNTDVGFYIHPTLVLDSESGFPLGLSTVKLWSRAINHADKHQREYQNLPIEEKESYKWLASAQSSQRCFEVGGAKMVTHIGDRESDLFEEFATVPNKNNHLLIRACQDRRLLGQSQSLFEYLSQQPCEGTYIINVPADPRRKRLAREAMLIVRCGKVEIQRPNKLSVFGYPPSVNLFAVEALEVQPPAGQEPIHWRLLTTHVVVCLEQALRVIQWYGWRWKIEQLFATLKKAGLNIEATQLESAIAIQRLTILALSVAVRTLQMVEGRDNIQISATLTFCAKQQQCLSVIQSSVEGDTKKLQNPYPQGCLPWATWIIARLGGWSGYTSARPPGMPTLVHGLRQFESIFLGWKLAACGLVYTR